jgi:hypothetical protein
MTNIDYRNRYNSDGTVGNYGIQGVVGLVGETGLTGITGLQGTTAYSGYYPREQGLKHTNTLMSMYPEKAKSFFAQLFIWLGFKDRELFE